jgi:hypothetical protein
MVRCTQRACILMEVENHGLHGITDAHRSSTFYVE